MSAPSLEERVRALELWSQNASLPSGSAQQMRIRDRAKELIRLWRDESDWITVDRAVAALEEALR